MIKFLFLFFSRQGQKSYQRLFEMNAIVFFEKLVSLVVSILVKNQKSWIKENMDLIFNGQTISEAIFLGFNSSQKTKINILRFLLD